MTAKTAKFCSRPVICCQVPSHAICKVPLWTAVWIQVQLLWTMNMVNSIWLNSLNLEMRRHHETFKSFVHSVIKWLPFANISDWANLWILLDTQNQKVFSFRGFAPDPHQGSAPWIPAGGSALRPPLNARALSSLLHPNPASNVLRRIIRYWQDLGHIDQQRQKRRVD